MNKDKAAKEITKEETVKNEPENDSSVPETAESQVTENRKTTDFDMGMPKEALTRKEQKLIDKKNKEIKKKYHVSNTQIIKNYRSYSEAEKKHYRYILGRRISDKVWPVFRFILLFGLAFVIMYPILYMISTSIRPQEEMTDPSVMWIPKTVIFSNFTDTWNAMNYPNVFKNTVTVNVICSLLQVVTCSITGYGFARFNFKGKGLMFGIVILQIIVPVQIILIPLFMQFRFFDPLGLITLFGGQPLNLVDNPIALYIQAFFNNGIRAGLFILLFRQFFRGLPKELEDAAYLDGCGPVQTFIRVMIPNALSNYLTVFIFSIVWYWNDSYVTGMFFTKSRTISLEIENLWRTVSQYLSPTGEITGTAQDYLVWVEAGCLLAILPILIMYIFLQRYFIEGVERSGIVG